MALVEAASTKARQFYRQLELTVLEGNTRAMAFYVKAGFAIDDDRTPAQGLGPRTVIAMVLAL